MADIVVTDGFNFKTNRKINEIILHCSATAEGKDVTVDTIRKWHLKNGWKDIGYHFVIYRDGTIHVGRPLYQVGAHTTGHNTFSIGICYIGGCAKDGRTPKDTRTVAQKNSLYWLVKTLQETYPKAIISGHYHWANKACPSFDVVDWLKECGLYEEQRRRLGI